MIWASRVRRMPVRYRLGRSLPFDFIMRLSGSVKLRCALGSGSSGSGAAGLPGFLRPSALRCRCFSASMRRSLLRGQLGVGLQRRHRLLDLRQPFRLIAGPVRHPSSPRLSLPKNLVLLDIRRPQRPPTWQATSAFNSALAFLHAFITHRFMFRRIRFDLRAIQCDVAEFDL